MKKWREEKVQKLTTQCIDGKLRSFKKWTRFLFAATITSRDPDLRSRTKINQKCEIAITFYDGLKWCGRCTVAARTHMWSKRRQTIFIIPNHSRHPPDPEAMIVSYKISLQNALIFNKTFSEIINYLGLRNNLYCIYVYCVFCPVKWNQIFYSSECYQFFGFSFVFQLFLFCSFVLLSCNKFDVVNHFIGVKQPS